MEVSDVKMPAGASELLELREPRATLDQTQESEMTVHDVVLVLVVTLAVIMLWIGRQARIVREEVQAKRLALEEGDRREGARRTRLLRRHRRG